MKKRMTSPGGDVAHINTSLVVALERVRILGVGFDRVTMAQALELIEGFIEENKATRPEEVASVLPAPRRVVTANPELVMMALDQPQLLRLLEESDLVVPDGAGVVWASRLLGQPLPERVAGFDLLLALFERGSRRGWRFYFLGARPGVAEAAARRVASLYPAVRVVGIHHGYFRPEEEAGILEDIRRSHPDVLLVALGQPRQELWIKENLGVTGARLGIGVGGSFDVLAGVARRAPRWLQRLNLEWLYRLWKEPRRAKRMLALPRFAARVLREAWGKRR